MLTADTFTNAGRATAQGGALTATVSKGVTNRGAGALGASGTLAIGLGGALSNAGSIVSQGAMTLAGFGGGRMASLTTLADSTINGAAGLTVRAADLSNAGSFASANGKLDMELSGFLSSTGFLYGGTAVHFKLDGAFTNTGGDVFAGTDLTVEGLSGARAGALDNSAGGRLVANGKLEATVTAFGNAGQTRAQGGVLTVDATGAVTNSSALVSSETVTIDTDGVLTNAAGGEIVSAGGVVLTADTFTNAGRATAQGGALTATVTKGVTNQGTGALGASGTLAIGLCRWRRVRRRPGW